MKAGRAAGFAVDGPRGPARVAQPGAVWLAGAAGQPLLPFHLEASRYWELGSWDRTQIPKPFSTVALVVGEPIAVAPQLSESELEAVRVELEARLRRESARPHRTVSKRPAAVRTAARSATTEREHERPYGTCTPFASW
jgi:lysophospholipid acyltransferase (LPLAT)-like uncharacterized protein